MEQTNHPAYSAAMDTARLLSGNFKLIRERKRELALNLVKASVVEGFALSEALKAAKLKMGWSKLAKDECNQMNVLFTAVRVIDGAWKALPEEKTKAFLAGSLVYSTLAKEIKDAEKADLEQETEQETETAPEPETASDPEPEPVQDDEPVTALDVALHLQAMLNEGVIMTDELAIALDDLRSKIEELAQVQVQERQAA